MTIRDVSEAGLLDVLVSPVYVSAMSMSASAADAGGHLVGYQVSLWHGVRLVMCILIIAEAITDAI